MDAPLTAALWLAVITKISLGTFAGAGDLDLLARARAKITKGEFAAVACAHIMAVFLIMATAALTPQVAGLIHSEGSSVEGVVAVALFVDFSAGITWAVAWLKGRRFTEEGAYEPGNPRAASRCIKYYNRPHGIRALALVLTMGLCLALVYPGTISKPSAIYILIVCWATNEITIGIWRKQRDSEVCMSPM